MRHAKATLELKPNGVQHAIELRPKAVAVALRVEPGRLHWGDSGNGVKLEFYRYDCQAGPVVLVSLDEAKVFLRKWQAAVDEAHRLEKEAYETAARELAP